VTALAPYADFLGTVATVWGVVGAFSSLLQARKLARTHSAESVSLGFLATFFGGYVTWALYGMAIESTPLIVVDLIGICTSSLTIGLALRIRHAADEALIGRGREQRAALGGKQLQEDPRPPVTAEVASCG
jgi:uncharacterized protein with PQ loop repeat